MTFSTAGRAPLKAEMNVIPMIDILLVLIIVFMVVVVPPFQSTGLEAQLPQPATKADNATLARTIVIQLASAGEDKRPALKINDETLAWDQLADRLVNILAQRAERVAFVKSDDDVDFRYVAEAISIAKNSGVERVGLLSKTDAESQ